MMLWNPPVTNNTLWTSFPVPNIEALKGKKIRAPVGRVRASQLSAAFRSASSGATFTIRPQRGSFRGRTAPH